jgi:hypothetical protein
MGPQTVPEIPDVPDGGGLIPDDTSPEGTSDSESTLSSDSTLSPEGTVIDSPADASDD